MLNWQTPEQHCDEIAQDPPACVQPGWHNPKEHVPLQH
jgi:hypothetical protein